MILSDHRKLFNSILFVLRQKKFATRWMSITMIEKLGCKDKCSYTEVLWHFCKKGATYLSLMVLIISSAIPTLATTDFTLQVFGNADMNDNIDENDVEYVQGIISGANEATRFADANHDGNVDEQDVEQIEKIIQETDEETMYEDSH